MRISDDEISEFLTHAGVKGMRWGVRKKTSRKEQKTLDRSRRKEIVKDKALDEIVARRRKEKTLKELLDDDLNPKRTAAKKFASAILKEHKTILVSSLITSTVGVAFMALQLNRSFDGISISPIPLR